MTARDLSEAPAMETRSATEPDLRRHVKFDLRTLRVNSTLTFDLHIRFGKDYVLYRHRALPFDQRT
ncbi:MAG: hypothetical protein IH988_08230, partial [Planctomycetes bacterium]|nr:hypothetical protein [Planctomycetota bacterium]